MKPISCPHEASVSRSARTGCWDDATKAHVKECAHCRETALITEWLGSIARMEQQEHPVPEAGQVWGYARLLALQAAREKALWPLAVAELVDKVAVILGLAAGIAWTWSGFQSLAASWLPGPVQALQPLILSLTALITSAALLLFLRLIGPVLTEE